jgi:hypothetical protein
MQHTQSEKIMVVVLEDMVNQSIPRILAIRQKVRHGELLTLTEVDFFHMMVRRLSRCYNDFAHDSQCMTIFACIAHMLYKVINRAHENEQKALRFA